MGSVLGESWAFWAGGETLAQFQVYLAFCLCRTRERETTHLTHVGGRRQGAGGVGGGWPPVKETDRAGTYTLTGDTLYRNCGYKTISDLFPILATYLLSVIQSLGKGSTKPIQKGESVWGSARKYIVHQQQRFPS
ncbi:hypothetical protein mRhiFer1_008947 [Rhinolophus ferrumequinum]|uniref:Uncharacterized protein n=1 Tax=Rhinolophus ferrumequinum TaxID=59479 RepID=A0A7J7TDZ7_RHIFE|nr:hypothetical protein mRhiFer1_008947 [Rhinolophus ferrumequinum]